MKLSAKLVGAERLSSMLAGLTPVVQRKVLRPALALQGRKLSKLTKANLKGSKESGMLKKSIGIKSKTKGGKDSFVYVVVGARWTPGTYKNRPRNPFYYFHLIEKGVRPHSVRAGASLRKMFSGQKQAGKMHPGFPGQFPLKRAYTTMAPVIGPQIVGKVHEEIKKYFAKKGGA